MTGLKPVPNRAGFAMRKALGIALSAASAAVAVRYVVKLTRICRKRRYLGETEKDLQS